jgi:transposase
VYIGIDVSRSKWAFNVRWANQERRQFSTPYGIDHVQGLVESYKDCELHLVYEACGFGYEIAWWCQQRQIAVTVVPPSTVERPPGLGVKTDRLDARLLCRKLEKAELKSAYIPSRSEHEHRQLSRTYTQALKDRKRQQARVRSLLQDQGRIGPQPSQGWRAYFRWLATQQLPECVELSIKQLLKLREEAAQRTAVLRTALLNLAKHPEYAAVVGALQSQRGVGAFTAIRLRLEIGDILRFHSAEAFVHYLGLTPSEFSTASEYRTGEGVRRGHILKCGPGLVRAWLIECAWASIRGNKCDPKLRACFDRLAPRNGRKRAIVAVARRLARKQRALWLQALQVQPQAPSEHSSS